MAMGAGTGEGEGVRGGMSIWRSVFAVSPAPFSAVVRLETSAYVLNWGAEDMANTCRRVASGRNKPVNALTQDDLEDYLLAGHKKNDDKMG